ncbi:MAG: hypothetical protein HZA54_05750, partial [Planctomycetes bacterium]|nr:hypothetical protein [Planctomycetota bacterium]
EKRSETERARELGSLLKRWNPFASWRAPQETEIAAALKGYAEFFFREIDTLDVVKLILGDKRFELAKLGVPHLVDQMGSRAEPFFTFSPELTAGSGNILDQWAVGTAGAENFAVTWRNAWERPVEVVETRDPVSLLVCRLRHGVPLFAIPHLAEFKKKYDLLTAEDAARCYVLQDAATLPEL